MLVIGKHTGSRETFIGKHTGSRGNMVVIGNILVVGETWLL